MAINKINFRGDSEVMCYSCHRCSHGPVVVPVIAEEGPNRPDPPTPADAAPALPTADQVFDQYLQAVGGAEALKKITTRVQKGNLDAGGTKSAVQVLAKAPNKRATGVMILQGLNVTAYDPETPRTAAPPSPP